MTDFLLENENARKLVKTLGLPIPVPEKLARAKGPYEERPLDDKNVLVCGVGELAERPRANPDEGRRHPWVVGDLRRRPRALCGTGRSLGAGSAARGAGRCAQRARASTPSCFDGTGLEAPEDLRQLYEFIHPWIRRLNPSGRVVVLGRPAADAKKPVHAATRAGLEGFTRSLAKEIGGNGSIANSVFVREGRRGATRRRCFDFSCLRGRRSSAASRFTSRPAPRARRRPRRTCSAARSLSSLARRAESAKPRPSFSPRRARTWFVSIGLRTTRRAAKWHSASADRRCWSTSPTRTRRSRIAAELKERFGGVDIVVHNAGVTRDKTLGRMKPDAWDMAVDINLGAVIRITDRLLRDEVLRTGGRIICLSSVSGIAGNRGQTNYSASKAGIVGFVRALAAKVAQEGHHGQRDRARFHRDTAHQRDARGDPRSRAPPVRRRAGRQARGRRSSDHFSSNPRCRRPDR